MARGYNRELNKMDSKPDRVLSVLTFGLVLFGIVMIYSASAVVAHQAPFFDDKFFVKKQIVSAIIGLVGMIVMANIDYRKWKPMAGILLGISFVLLISVFMFSKGEINGAHRWIIIAGQNFQPSELVKLIFVIYVAGFVVERQDKMHSLTETFLPFLIVLGGISVLVLKQPDFGTLSIIIVAALAVYFVGGMTFQQIVIGGFVAFLALMVILSNPYRRERILTFQNPEADQSGSSYHIKNISIAIGSGGMNGLGFGNSRQKRLFLPEPHTDSIFAIIVEELGSIRAGFLVLVYAYFIIRGFMVANKVPELFGKLIMIGIMSWFGFQAFINLGSMLHIVPLVGVPLPFVSYGGTNLMISLMAMGIVLNISSTAKLETATPKRHKKRR